MRTREPLASTSRKTSQSPRAVSSSVFTDSQTCASSSRTGNRIITSRSFLLNCLIELVNLVDNQRGCVVAVLHAAGYQNDGLSPQHIAMFAERFWPEQHT